MRGASILAAALEGGAEVAQLVLDGNPIGQVNNNIILLVLNIYVSIIYIYIYIYALDGNPIGQVDMRCYSHGCKLS